MFALVNEKRFDGISNVCKVLEVLANTLEDYMGGTSGGVSGGGCGGVMV